tara:strand:- start:1785 stop:2237 length:453 start_codon:yes stop_codon:yes gene_type:complete
MATRIEAFLGRWLFPLHSRQFAGKRWCKIGLRTLHLFGIAGIGGAFLYHAPANDWLPFLWLTLATGTLMVLIELWSHCIWLLQLRGILILIKLVLLGLTAILPPSFDSGILFVVIMISGVISHASSRQRYYSPFYGRKITLDDWQWPSHG